MAGALTTTDQVRTGVFMHYALAGCVRGEPVPLLPAASCEQVEPELRALIGYSKGGYVLGFL